MRCPALSWTTGAVRAGAGVAACRRGRVAGSVLSDDGLAAGRVEGLRAGAVAGFRAGAAVRVVSRGGGWSVCCASARGARPNVRTAIESQTAPMYVRNGISHLYGRSTAGWRYLMNGLYPSRRDARGFGREF